MEVVARDAKLPLATPVHALRGVGPAATASLAAAGIATLRDLLLLFPRRHDVVHDLQPGAPDQLGQLVRLTATIADVRRQFLPGRRSIVRVRLRHAGGDEIEAPWFNQPWLARTFTPGRQVTLIGRLEQQGGGYRLVQPRVAADDGAVVLLAYPEIDGIGERRLRSWIAQALALAELAPDTPESLPTSLRGELPTWAEAIRAMHAPRDAREHEHARRSFALREAVALFADVERARRARLARRALPVDVTPEIAARIRARIPFEPTAEQARAIAAIHAQLAGPAPMGVLLQGDVGSGKTVVALAAALAVLAAGAQVAFLAPTELLAEQQHDLLMRWLAGSRITPALLTAGVDAERRRELERGLRSGDVRLVVGTHALLTERVAFRQLALVIVDEQHRFGVAQRSALLHKGRAPHQLVLTATPIPRTLALALFGDLDVVTLRERPGGRSLPPAVHVPRRAWRRIERALARCLRRGGRAYVVAPSIGEAGEQQSAVAVCARLARRFPVALVHGRMPAAERRDAVDRFRRGEVQLLVGTTVLEVGVDVPEATLIVILGAERFGLATLHQLRGRVGRGSRRGLCIVTGERTPRVELLCRSRDGFELSQQDLRLRGAGEVFGTRQSGRHDLRAFDPIEDLDLLLRVRDAVRGHV